jgi:uncharacterized membrane protein YfbV (UPF0208 family)
MLLLATWREKENCFKLVDKVISRIKFEIEQIDRLFASYADLLEQTQRQTPDLVKVTAVASVLHSFYNGLEGIFLVIVKRIDQDVPEGAQWHRDLLARMIETTSSRGPVLTVGTVHQLADYLGFRHFYRHSYSFFLDWDELEELVMPLSAIWEQTKGEIQQFLDSLDQPLEGN